MNIIHLSTYDVKGGAARAAYRLHCGLREQGEGSKMLVEQKLSEDSDVRTLQSPMNLKARLKRRLRRRLIEKEFAP